MNTLTDSLRRRLVWPLPALLAWGAAWLAHWALSRAGTPAWLTLAVPTGVGIALAALGSTRWRRGFIAVGFPLSLAASGAAAGWPAWVWLAPLALLALAYPVHAWRDAPLFPTPAQALRGLAVAAPLRAGGRVLDAGCGVGDGLIALRGAYPAARISGTEWSRPWAWLAQRRCRWAEVARGDLWAQDWRAFDLVYLFQRPESMARAMAKAERELGEGAWLVSLAFPALGWRPHTVLRGASARPVWIYRMPPQAEP